MEVTDNEFIKLLTQHRRVDGVWQLRCVEDNKVFTCEEFRFQDRTIWHEGRPGEWRPRLTYLAPGIWARWGPEGFKEVKRQWRANALEVLRGPHVEVVFPGCALRGTTLGHLQEHVSSMLIADPVVRASSLDAWAQCLAYGYVRRGNLLKYWVLSAIGGIQQAWAGEEVPGDVQLVIDKFSEAANNHFEGDQEKIAARLKTLLPDTAKLRERSRHTDRWVAPLWGHLKKPESSIPRSWTDNMVQFPVPNKKEEEQFGSRSTTKKFSWKVRNFEFRDLQPHSFSWPWINEQAPAYNEALKILGLDFPWPDKSPVDLAAPLFVKFGQ